MKEYLLDVDSFNQPKVLSGKDADIQLVYNALIRREDDSFLDNLSYMIQRFRFKELNESISEIQNTLLEYCRTKIPTVNINDITIKKRTDTSFYLIIEILNDDDNETSNMIFDVKQEKDKLLVDILNAK